MERLLKKMLWSLSIGSLLFVYVVYLSHLFLMGDAYMIWLVGSVLVSVLIGASALYHTTWLARRFVRNILLLLELFSLGYGTILASYMYRPFSSILSVFGLVLIVVLLVTLYQTSLKNRPSFESKMLHIVNITVGILLACGTLTFLYMFLLLSEDGKTEMWKIFAPFVLYIILYMTQMQLMRNSHPGIAYSVAVVQVLVPISLVSLWMMGVLVV